ncbi:YbhB/YbcL family Raf kinase inhibitor-like protein [Candidatus Pacearchaeota archaeon CG10_big_fil_rev_8_21_14_0_10_35_13]|nr:MAG: YbhB/YbcL family Raf kinase inhibitor-like protein [Candidatus Pacearchaeota archaeon CG10_big_fil_rev_8_21_14_0_10_35_13]
MKITSVFVEGEEIPSKYTCDGENINPEIVINEIPEGTKSLVIIMYDPDIPEFVKEKFGIKEFNHWVIYNIKTERNELIIQENNVNLGTRGMNSKEELGYTGPCPPDRRHRYYFEAYALKEETNIKEGATREEVMETINGKILGKAVLIGTYVRIAV